MTDILAEPIRIDSEMGPVAAVRYRLAETGLETSPAVIVCHGFAGAKYPAMNDKLVNRGFVVIDVDFPNYGATAGPADEVNPNTQVRVVLDTVDHVKGVADSWLGVIGSSLGGSVVLRAAAKEPRIEACVAGCPLGQGRRSMRQHYLNEAEWQNFLDRIDSDDGLGATFDRYEIVYLPEHLRGQLGESAPMKFNAATARAFVELDVDSVAAALADRPVLLLHAKDDEVVSYSESLFLLDASGGKFELHTLEAGNHFIFNDEDVQESIVRWLSEQHEASMRGHQ